MEVLELHHVYLIDQEEDMKNLLTWFLNLVMQLDQMRLGLVYTGDEKVNSGGAEFVTEDMSRDAAEVFSKLNLDKYIPA